MTERIFKSSRVNRLPVQVAIIVPSTSGGNEINGHAFKKRVKKTKRFMDNLFGGDTSVKGVGGWIDKQDDLVTEDVVKVESSTTHEEFHNKKDKLRKYIKKKRNSWKQDQLMYEHDGVSYAYPQKNWMADEPR